MKTISMAMEEMHDLHFSSPPWKFWAQGFWLLLLSAVILVLGLLALKIPSYALGVFLIVIGAAFVLLSLSLFVLRVKSAWRQWRQLHPPDVLVDAVGVHYMAARPADVPWSDIEQVCLTRTYISRRTIATFLSRGVISKVYVRLKPDAALLREEKMGIPDSHHLNVGLLSQTGVMDEVAIRILTEVSGAPLEVEEIDRRPAY